MRDRLARLVAARRPLGVRAAGPEPGHLRALARGLLGTIVVGVDPLATPASVGT